MNTSSGNEGHSRVAGLLGGLALATACLAAPSFASAMPTHEVRAAHHTVFSPVGPKAPHPAAPVGAPFNEGRRQLPHLGVSPRTMHRAPTIKVGARLKK